MRSGIMDNTPPPWPIRQNDPPIMNSEPSGRDGTPIWVYIIFAIIVMGTLAFLGKDIWDAATASKTAALCNNTENLSAAFTSGANAVMIQLLKSTNDCQVASINYQNFSRDITDVACVTALLKQKNITLG